MYQPFIASNKLLAYPNKQMLIPTTLEQLDEWMKAPREIEGLEFKAVRTNFHGDKLMDYCVGIGNDGGGKLILGVTNALPRQVVGTSVINDTQEMQKKILDKLHFEVKIEEITHPKGRVIICHIPSRPMGQPFHHDGRYLMRSGEELRAMSPDRLREIFSEGKPNWLLRMALNGCSQSDVFTLLDTQTYYFMLHQPYPTSKTTILERFQAERLISEEQSGYSITNLGAILFARKLNQFEGLIRKAPRVVVYSGKNKLHTRKLFEGGKGYACGFVGLIEFINSYIPSNEVMVKALRTEVKMFPEIAIREIIANALIHQEFSEEGTSVTVEIYDDRIEVSNPGLPIIPPDRFADEYQSRNDVLAGLARRLGICEELGLGIDRVLQSTEVFQLPAPAFRLGERHITVALFAHKKFADMDRGERVQACFWHCVLRYINNNKMTNASLRDRFNLPESKSETVSKVIRQTMDEEKIKPVDPTRASKKFASYVPPWA